MKTIKGNATRPTSDRVKESLFNIIAPFVEGSDVLDLFAGTGSLGIEALSRGASSAVFTDKSRESCSAITDNLNHTKLQDKGEVYQIDYIDAIDKMARENRKFQLVFLDPPYSKNFIQETLKHMTKNDIISDDGIIIAEHYFGDILPEAVGRIKLVRSWKYGETVLSVYRPENTAAE